MFVWFYFAECKLGSGPGNRVLEISTEDTYGVVN